MTANAELIEDAAVYSLFLVIAETELIESHASADEAIRLTNELDSVFRELDQEQVRVRGIYDLTGFDASASVMIWLTSGAVDDLQWAKRQLNRTQILGDTLVIESILALGVSDLTDEPGGWISLAPVSPGPADDEFEDEDSEFEEGDLEDSDFEDLDADYLDQDELDAEAGSEVVAGTVGETGTTGADDATHSIQPDDRAPEGADDDETDGAETDDDENDDSETDEGELESTSLHAQIGIGPVRLFAAVEANDPSELIGPSLGLLESGLMTVATPRTGRFVTPAELYEILR